MKVLFVCSLVMLFLGATLVLLSQNVIANSSSPEPLPVVSSSSGRISGSPYLQIPEDKLNWPAVIPPPPHVAEATVDPTAAAVYEVATQKVIRIPSAQQASPSGVASTPPYQGLLPNQGLLPIAPRSVLGGDDRQKITNTEDYPWRTVVKLYMTAADGTHWIGSGAIIGRADGNGFHVLTAGHCVYMHDRGGWVTSIEVIPGLDGTYMPYYHAWATYLRAYTGWTDSQDWRHDWAVVTLDRRVGNSTGWMGRITSTDSNFYLGGFNCAGYPGDLDSGLSMYWDFDYGCDSDEYKHWYKMDTASGQSGMPVWVYDYYGQGDRYIATVHAYGNDDHCSGGSNSGTRLNQDKFDRATTWVNADTPPTDYANLIDDGQAWSGFSPTTVRAGDSFNVWCDVRNIGTASSGGFYVAYYASTNNFISTYDYLICEDYVSSIDPFNYRDSNCSVSFPSNIPPGTYYVGWIIDSRDNVNEARDNGEDNNTAYKDSYQLTVLPPAPPPTPSVFRVESSGDVLADGPFYGASFNAGSADVAEWVPVSEPVEPGDVLEFDPNRAGHYRKSRGPCSDLVAGVVSTEPGFVLGSSSPALDLGLWTDGSRPVTEDSRPLTDGSRPVTEDSALLALIGIVPVKVTDEGGPIQPGDLLVSSSTPGYAMKWNSESGGVCGLIGKALEPLDSGTGVIQVLLMR
jgi:V8-like Glu-specific endopeptidase